MAQATEISEREPWTIQRVLGQLGRIGALDAKEVLAALRPEREKLALALREALRDRSGKAKVTAAVLLLVLNDTSGREPFLEALAGPDGDVRTLAIEFVQDCICPHDIEIPGRPMRCPIPISSDELFAALERDLHEPWTGLSRRILAIVSRQDYPQARSITRPLLTHHDTSLRMQIAETYLRAGRDEGAFAVVEEFLQTAPTHAPYGDPRWNDCREAQGLWYCLSAAAERGDLELGMKAASLVMALVTQALDAPNLAQRFDINDGLIRADIAAKILAVVKSRGAKALLERLIACDAINDFYRGEALLAYALALGEGARHVVLSQLRNHDLRQYAARAVEPLVKDRNDPLDIAALSNALTHEERPCVVAAIAKALLAAGLGGQAVVEAVSRRVKPARHRRVKTSQLEKGKLRPTGFRAAMPQKEICYGECPQDGEYSGNTLVTRGRLETKPHRRGTRPRSRNRPKIRAAALVRAKTRKRADRLG